jgi:hypothetical protein
VKWIHCDVIRNTITSRHIAKVNEGRADVTGAVILMKGPFVIITVTEFGAKIINKFIELSDRTYDSVQ